MDQFEVFFIRTVAVCISAVCILGVLMLFRLAIIECFLK